MADYLHNWLRILEIFGGLFILLGTAVAKSALLCFAWVGVAAMAPIVVVKELGGR